MMKKLVSIEVLYDLKENAYLPTPVGRLHIGTHIARLFFNRITDQQVLVLPEGALKDGSVVVVEESNLVGLGKLDIVRPS